MFQPEFRGMPIDGEGVARTLGDRLRALPHRYLWLALTLLLLPAGLLAVEINPQPRTFLIAAIYVAALAASAWMLRKPEPLPQPDPNDAAACLHAKIVSTRRELSKVDGWMRLFPAGIALAVLLKFSTLTNLDIAAFFPLVLEMARSGSRTVIAFLILLAVLVHFIRRSLMLRRELTRLESLQTSLARPAGAPLPPA